MALYRGHTTEIYKPTGNVNFNGNVLTGSYNLLYAGRDCRFHPLNSQQKIVEGVLDISKDMRAVFFGINEIQELGLFYILRDMIDKSCWLVTRPVIHETLPKGHWKAIIEYLKAPPKEII